MSDWYYLDRQRRRHGPLTDEGLRELARSGRFDSATRVWRDGLPRWMPLAELAGELRLGPLPPPAEEAPEVPVAAEPVVAEPVAAEARPQAPPLPDDDLPPWRGAEAPDPRAQELLCVGLGKRSAAFMLDQLIVSAALFPVLLPISLLLAASGSDVDAAMRSPLAQLLSLVVLWLYFAFCESSRLRGTIGKRALGMYVTRPHGPALSFGRATLRFFAAFPAFLFFGIGILMIAVHPKKQGLHDLIADSYVVADSPEKLEMKPFDWMILAVGVLLLLIATSLHPQS